MEHTDEEDYQNRVGNGLRVSLVKLPSSRKYRQFYKGFRYAIEWLSLKDADFDADTYRELFDKEAARFRDDPEKVITGLYSGDMAIYVTLGYLVGIRRMCTYDEDHEPLEAIEVEV